MFLLANSLDATVLPLLLALFQTDYKEAQVSAVFHGACRDAVERRRDASNSSSPISCSKLSKALGQGKLPAALSSWVLKITKDGENAQPQSLY